MSSRDEHSIRLGIAAESFEHSFLLQDQALDAVAWTPLWRLAEQLENPFQPIDMSFSLYGVLVKRALQGIGFGGLFHFRQSLEELLLSIVSILQFT